MRKTPNLIPTKIRITPPDRQPCGAFGRLQQIDDLPPRGDVADGDVLDGPGVLAETLRIAFSLGGGEARSKVLVALAPHLAPSLLVAALQGLGSVQDEQKRSLLLVALAPYLPTESLSRAIGIVRTIRDERFLLGPLTALAPHLPPGLLASLNPVQVIGR